MGSFNWDQEELELIRALRENKNALSWDEVAEHINKKFGTSRTPDSARCAYRRWKDIGILSDEDATIRAVKQTRSAKKTSSFNARALRNLIDKSDAEGDIIERIGEVAKKLDKYTPKLPKLRRYPKKFNMTLELLLSDLHFGKLITNNGEVLFDEKIARRRMRDVTNVVLKELTINQKNYNIDTIIVALMGDILESYEMHLLESARGCEYGTAKQMQVAIESIMFDVLIPLAETGLKIEVPAITGNHDRSQQKRTYVNPGENNWTWVIYHSLKSLVEAKGYKNVTFYIPTGCNVIIDVFGNNVMYEHGDNSAPNRAAFEKLISSRSRQAGKIIDFMRIGHYHEHDMMGEGRIVKNGSLPGADGFSDAHGWPSVPSQVLNYYLDYPLKLKDGQRKNTFHKTFGIKLE